MSGSILGEEWYLDQPAWLFHIYSCNLSPDIYKWYYRVYLLEPSPLASHVTIYAWHANKVINPPWYYLQTLYVSSHLPSLILSATKQTHSSTRPREYERIGTVATVRRRHFWACHSRLPSRFRLHPRLLAIYVFRCSFCSVAAFCTNSHFRPASPLSKGRWT